MRRSQLLRLLFDLLILPSPTLAFWRVACSVSQTARVDPILDPNNVSGHVHKFAGGNNVNQGSDFNSLQLSSCSTCQIQEDRSAYWTPQLYFAHANGSFEEVQNDGMTVYYVGRPGLDSSGVPTQAFPPGFKMISGDSRQRSYDSQTLTYQDTRPVADRVSFRCINEANDIPEEHYMFRTECVNGMRAQVNFQSCWDGVNTYLENSAHVAYVSGIDYGECPPTHPVPIPGLFFEVLYWTNRVDQSAGGQFVFSNGDTTGYGFHGDFMNGWNQEVQTNAVRDCLYTDNEGIITACPHLAPSSTDDFARICPEQPSVLDEPVHGMVSALAGCNPITSGPDLVPQVVCPLGSNTPSEGQTAAPQVPVSSSPLASSVTPLPSQSPVAPFPNTTITQISVPTTDTLPTVAPIPGTVISSVLPSAQAPAVTQGAVSSDSTFGTPTDGAMTPTVVEAQQGSPTLPTVTGSFAPASLQGPSTAVESAFSVVTTFVPGLPQESVVTVTQFASQPGDRQGDGRFGGGFGRPGPFRNNNNNRRDGLGRPAGFGQRPVASVAPPWMAPSFLGGRPTGAPFEDSDRVQTVPDTMPSRTVTEEEVATQTTNAFVSVTSFLDEAALCSLYSEFSIEGCPPPRTLAPRAEPTPAFVDQGGPPSPAGIDMITSVIPPTAAATDVSSDTTSFTIRGRVVSLVRNLW